MDQPVIIIKASGEREPFDESKLRRSLLGAGAEPNIIEKILARVRLELRTDMTTTEIYRRAFDMLREYKPHIAARYSLKRAMMELGPSGHPFEKFVGEVLHSEGYKTEVNKIIQGICVTHEVDVVAEKEGRRAMIELKYHNALGIKTDIKIALYIQARFEDIDKSWQRHPDNGIKLHEAWLMTNTKLTSDAIAYARCVGMKAIGWNYPEQGNLKELIERSGLHPISALTSLSRSEKEKLLDKGLVMCRDVKANKDVLSLIGVGKDESDQIVAEADKLCGGE
jgi:hypothetical protein